MSFLSKLTGLIAIGAGLLAPFTGGLSLAGLSLSSILYTTSIVAGAISANLQAQEMKRKMQKGSGHLLNTINTKANIPLVYGECRVGGNIVYRATRGSDNKELYQVYTLSEGQINTLKDVYFDGHIPDYFKLEKKTDKYWEYKVDDTITDIELDVRVADKYNWWNGYSGNSSIHKFENIRVSKGSSTVVSDTLGSQPEVTVSFDSATNKVRIEITNVNVNGNATDNNGNSISPTLNDVWMYQVSGVRLSSNNQLSWIKPAKLDGLYDYIWFDGQDWYKWDETNNTWVVDNNFNTNTILGAIADTSQYSDTFDYSKIDKSNGNPPVSLLCMKFKAEQNKWTSVPQITALIEGMKKPNPFNNNTVEVIKNPVWALFDYLTDTTYGLGIPYDEFEGYDTTTNTFNLTSTWKKAYDFANAKGLEFNGVFTEGKGFDIVKQILDHFFGYTIKINGKRECHYKYFNTSDNTYTNTVYSYSITTDDIIDDITTTNNSWSSMPSKLRINFLNPILDYKEDVLEITTGNSGISEDYVTLDLLGCNKETAKWIGNYFLERQRNGFTISVVLPPKYIDLMWGDLVQVVIPERDILGHFRVIDKVVNTTNIKFTLIYEDEAFYNTVLDNVTYTYVPSQSFNPADYPPDITSITYNATHIQQLDGTTLNYIALGWTYNYLWISDYEVWKSDDGINYELLATVTDKSYTFQAPATNNVIYIKILPTSIYGVKLPLNSATAHTINLSTDVTPPATPTNLTGNLSVAGTKAYLNLNWDAVSDLDLKYYYVYVSLTTETNLTNATRVLITSSNSTHITIPDLLPTSLRDESQIKVWVTAVDSSMNESGAVTDIFDITFTPNDTSEGIFIQSGSNASALGRNEANTVDGQIHTYYYDSATNTYVDLMSQGWVAPVNSSVDKSLIEVYMQDIYNYMNTQAIAGVLINGRIPDKTIISNNAITPFGVKVDLTETTSGSNYGIGIDISSYTGLKVNSDICLNLNYSLSGANHTGHIYMNIYPSPPTWLAPAGMQVMAKNNSGQIQMYTQVSEAYDENGNAVASGGYGYEWKAFAYV